MLELLGKLKVLLVDLRVIAVIERERERGRKEIGRISVI